MLRSRVLAPTLSFVFLMLLSTGVQAQRTEAAFSNPQQQKIADFIEEWSSSGLQVQMIGGYVKLINGAGETITAATVAQRTAMDVSDDDLYEVITQMMAASGAAPKVQSCSISGAGAPCSELTLTSNYDACLLDGSVADDAEDLQQYAAAMQLDGKIYDSFSLPSFAAMDLAGNPVDSQKLAGKSSLVAILSEKCGHSLRSISTLVRLQKRHPDLNVVAVFVDTSPEAVKKAVGDRRLPELVWVSSNAASMTRTALLPTILLTDESGSVRSRQVGEKRQRLLEERIAKDLNLASNQVGMNAN